MSKIIIHGGFFSESSTNIETKIAKQQALLRIVKDSYAYLQNHSALETVVYAVSQLEDDELFNAGIGSQIQSDGKIRMSASLMDGESQKMSGVINIEEVKNPIQVAQVLMQVDDRILGGSGATNFARKAVWMPIKDMPELAFDHSRIFRKSFEKIKNKISYQPIAFELLPEKFTLTQLQHLYEVILNKTLDKRNFRKKMLAYDILKELDEKQKGVSYRAAKLYKFDKRKYAKNFQKELSFTR